ncbi:MAG TPA: 3-hydroxyacyl-CoA dehydrogenase NAD-binding domain-containing protein, partial [Phnomibacter sp.]|nr:3-hydroxyacyl-CoA dehydrogenase NAD-binding domain-containing protein [Phnomibacter sp.]
HEHYEPYGLAAVHPKLEKGRFQKEIVPPISTNFAFLQKKLNDRMYQISNVAVIGAGTMGNGIAHVFAQHGFRVNLIDVSEKQLAKAMDTIGKNLDRQVAKGVIDAAAKENTLHHLTTMTSITAGISNVQLVVEAATENVDLKLKIFKELGEEAPAECILATNTSSISITKIAAVTGRGPKVIGMHFMNPVPVMKLVEIINGYATEKEVTNAIVDLSKALGKVPCVVNDYPGFVANRILMPMINEAIYTLYEGVAGVEEIDTVMKLGMAHPMGPLQLADFIGLDVCLSILRVMHDGFGNPKYAPCPLLVNMVAAGRFGVKSGEGFYTYTPGSKEMTVAYTR